jgi:site-specific recombinase XerD
MTHETLTRENHIQHNLYQHLKTHPLYINLEPSLQSIPSLQSKKLSENDETSLRWFGTESSRQGLEAALTKLSKKEIPGKSYINEYLRDQYRRHCRPNTLRNSLIAIDQFLDFIKRAGKTHLEEITRKDLGAWIEHGQDRGLKASTVKMRLRTLNAFLRYLIERDVIRPEVLSRRMIIKVPDSLPRAMDPEEIRHLISVIDTIRDRAMILVLLRTGMRIGELLTTSVKDVNLTERRIAIYEAEKTRIGRVVYLSDDAIGALKAWLKKRDPHKASLFYGQGRHMLTYPAARAMFKKYLDRAGLSHTGYSLHCLRHTCATELLNAGMRLECLQQLLGHSSIEMTRRYARLTDKTREEEYFKAMSIIERGETHVYYQLDSELQATPQEKELFTSYVEELHEHP